MRDQWWTFGQACSYVHANFPCETGVAANRLLTDKIADGTLTTRYEDSGPLVRPDEWVRYGDIDLRVEGSGVHHGSVEYLRSSVEKLCSRQSAGGSGGRPLKDWETFLIEVIAVANTPDGLPDKQAKLVEKMLLWAESNMADPPGETSVRDMVSKIYARLRRR